MADKNLHFVLLFLAFVHFSRQSYESLWVDGQDNLRLTDDDNNGCTVL
jgi:hypothetical protein